MKAKLMAIFFAPVFLLNCNDSAIVETRDGASEPSVNRSKPDKIVFFKQQ
jgi:hypothetical protein